MTKHRFELARGRRLFIERSLRASAPSCVVLIVGAGALSFMEQELSALVSGCGCLSAEAARRAAVLAWSLDVAAGTRPERSDVFALGAAAFPGRRWLANGTLLEASGRYWVPPRCRVWLEGERVCLAPREAGDDHPLDELLTSLARSWGPRSIAVLPMAPGLDGERGVGALRAAGGLALQNSDGLDGPASHAGARSRRQPS
jgi:hypothetical protein